MNRSDSRFHHVRNSALDVSRMTLLLLPGRHRIKAVKEGYRDAEQEIVVEFEPEKAVETLPRLLADRADRARLLALLERLSADKRVRAATGSPEQSAMLARIRGVLGAPARLAAVPAPKARKAAARRGRSAKRA